MHFREGRYAATFRMQSCMKTSFRIRRSSRELPTPKSNYKLITSIKRNNYLLPVETYTLHAQGEPRRAASARRRGLDRIFGHSITRFAFRRPVPRTGRKRLPP